MGNEKKVRAAAAALALLLLAAGGCESGGKTAANGPETGNRGGGGAGAQTNGVYADNGLPADQPVTLKLGFFEDGMGREWIDYAIDTFRSKYPNVRFAVTYSPNISAALGAKIAADNDDDMFDLFSPIVPGGTVALIPLAKAGKLETQEELWDWPLADGGERTIREAAQPGAYETAPRMLGRTYALPAVETVSGLFFNKRLFEQNGWNANPRTWAEFLDLCASIKAAGLSPLTFPGRIPDYINHAFGPWKQFELADLHGRLPQFEDDFRHFRNEYTSPESVELWSRVYELGRKGYFADGLAALTHTQSQIRMLQGKAALASTGVWVQNEMKYSIPDDFRWGFLSVPMGDDPDDAKWLRGSFGNGLLIWSGKPELNKRWAKQFCVWLWNMDVQTVIAAKGGQLPIRRDFYDDRYRVDRIQDAAKAVYDYMNANNVRLESGYRAATLTDPAYVQSLKIFNETIPQIALGRQEPLPILEESQRLIDRALAANP